MKKTQAIPALISAVLLSVAPLQAHQFIQQTELQTFASNARFEMAVVSNFADKAGTFTGQLQLNNQSAQALAPGIGNWQIYFHSIRKLQLTAPAGLTLEHVQGDLHRLAPTKAFKGLAAGAALTVEISGAPFLVSYSDFMPRAFIVAGKLQPEVFSNTDTEDFSQFVAPLRRPEQLYRYQQPEPDLYKVATAQSRFQDNQAVNATLTDDVSIADQIIPTPQQQKLLGGRLLLDQQWTIRFQGRLKAEAAYLQDRLGIAGIALKTVPGITEHSAKQIQLRVDPALTTPESYRLLINDQQILISGADNAGVFYGLQSLLALTPAQFSSVRLAQQEIQDSPRYRWRGMHYDMARNFHGKAVTLRLIEQMARYKMNKLHLHLTEDEGWRLEIPGLPELTTIGAKRCFDLTEQQCLLTQLGTGPHQSGSGNGFYSRDDFIEILKYASARHIEVIPEIDMPGHARAAVVAMQARYQRLLKQGKKAEAEQYLLSDPADQSKYLTVQNYTDNSVNVCMDSSYAFIDKVVYELQQMYRAAGLKLSTYHMGGDEVGAGSWTASPQCQTLFAKGIPGVAGVADLKPYFVSKVAALLHSRQLALGGWEDGLMYDPINPFNREQFANKQVYANVWDNIWEWGYADRAYRLANAGYQVVMSHGTHLYLDHPNETHPDERGYYWAARFTDAKKVFGYMPDDVYANADKTRSGAVINDLEHLVGRALPKLEKPENILGMQGQVWSETIRTASQLEEMVYPRLLPIAERAWHKASWEADANSNAVKPQERDQAWQLFARTMTQKELPKLSQAGVQYYLPPVGAEIKGGSLYANVAYPGLTIELSLDGGRSWQRYQEAIPLAAGTEVRLRSRSADGRSSRETQLPEVLP
ncbi:family 20 glycosylhydrolase [Rheinheimera texasensis]|uniref:family 20 glycosylhydrolase n=1 Tax=Rheinheimera texasensis TaxID=306205 RepID=UPI0004E1B20A|nr:family 20 glycosylhydrolase [Rheinheimera texasensis]